MLRQSRHVWPRHVLLCVSALIIVSLFASDAAHAQSVLGKADSFLQKIIDALTGTTGKLVSTIAVVAVGLAAVFGRIEWTKALIVLAGIAIIVGAPQLVNALWGG
jgi:type IV secretion system protein VirB2